MTDERKPIGLAELVARVGDDNVTIEPVDANIISARRLKEKRPSGLSEIKLLTSQTDPDDVMRLTIGQPMRRVGMVVWIPREKYEDAITAHHMGEAIPVRPAAPSDADTIAAAATARVERLDSLLRSLLVDSIEIGRGYTACRHCYSRSISADSIRPILHKPGCVVWQVTAALGGK